MIVIRGLRKNFEGKEVLKGIDLEIPDGKTTVILGPSGQGKTVLLKNIIGLYKPDSGEIIVDGVDITRLSRKRLFEIRKKFAFVFQGGALFDFLNVKENLALYLRMHLKMKEDEIERKVKEVLRVVGMSGTEHLYPEELSGGMKKRVAIARAVISSPKYILYDEPTTGLDRTNARVVNRLINRLKEKYGVTSIVVTHDIECMKTVADRVALLKEGKIIFVGLEEEVEEKHLDYLYELEEEYAV
ncbi:MAG: ATP-binding cassette domain-containing protein [Candidatus Aminicenantes bacterium]|nr:ATP-binding cassette domain-containing protein [Candidatus Aminicenantes bacterium]